MSFTPSPYECGSGSFCSTGYSTYSLRDTYTFPYSGPPLVYYADVKRPELYKYKSQAKNKKPNYFIKAFQWYTQDHGANKRVTVNEKQEIGFATWLDQKYEQYLWDVQLKDEALKSGVSSTVHSPTNSQDVATRKSDKPKGIQKILRSPWRKRRASAKSPEKRHDSSECRPSWQIILRPKSMSRLTSDICSQKVSLKFCASSKLSIASSDTQMTTRTYSKRLGIVVQELLVRPNDTPDSDNHNRDKENSVKHNTSRSQHTDNDCYSTDNRIKTEKTKSEKIYPNTTTRLKKKKSVKNSKINVTCECPVVTKQMDLSTQYGSNMLNTEAGPGRSIITTAYRDKSSFSEKNSKTNVKCECLAVPKEQTNSDEIVKRTHNDPDIYNSKKKPLENTTTTISGENSSIVQNSKTDMKSECPVITKETPKNDNMVTQRNPNIVEKEDKFLGQTSATRFTSFGKSSDPLGPQHEGRQGPEGSQPRIHRATQTAHSKITLSALENATIGGLPRFVRVMITKQ